MKKLKERFIKLKALERLYQYDRPIIALTGGIATGKSTVTKMLEARGIQVIDADQLVKSIYRTDEAKKFIRDHYPRAIEREEIDFKILRELFFEDPRVKSAVESFIYQRLPQAFIDAASKIKNQSFYLYDVPLLFEKKLDEKVDLSIVVYAPQKIQLARLMDRDGHEETMAKTILNHQMDIEDKKEKADFVINNSFSVTELSQEVEQLLREILD